MNLNKNPSIDELKQLVASQQDDRYDHILYVTKEGDVYFAKLDLTQFPVEWDEQNEDSYQFRFESFLQGNGYVGPEASQADSWMQRLMKALQENWRTKKVGYIDNF